MKTRPIGQQAALSMGRRSCLFTKVSMSSFGLVSGDSALADILNPYRQWWQFDLEHAHTLKGGQFAVSLRAFAPSSFLLQR